MTEKFGHENQQKVATLSTMMDWDRMTAEMKSRMRAAVPIRTNQTSKQVNTVSAAVVVKENVFFKCWLCRTSEHWLDKCSKFLEMMSQERLQKVKESHACFCCLNNNNKSLLRKT